MDDLQTLENGDYQPRDPTDWEVVSNSTTVQFNSHTDSSLEGDYHQPSMQFSSDSASLPIDPHSMPTIMELTSVHGPLLPVQVEDQISAMIRNTVDERRRHLEEEEDSTPGCLGIVYWMVAIFMLVFFSVVFMLGFVTLIKDLWGLYGTDEGRSDSASGVDKL
jgi:hypothetical protein